MNSILSTPSFTRAIVIDVLTGSQQSGFRVDENANVLVAKYLLYSLLKIKEILGTKVMLPRSIKKYQVTSHQLPV